MLAALRATRDAGERKNSRRPALRVRISSRASVLHVTETAALGASTSRTRLWQARLSCQIQHLLFLYC